MLISKQQFMTVEYIRSANNLADPRLGVFSPIAQIKLPFGVFQWTNLLLSIESNKRCRFSPLKTGRKGHRRGRRWPNIHLHTLTRNTSLLDQIKTPLRSLGTQFRDPNQPIPLRRNDVWLALPEGGRFCYKVYRNGTKRTISGLFRIIWKFPKSALHNFAQFSSKSARSNGKFWKYYYYYTNPSTHSLVQQYDSSLRPSNSYLW